MQERALQREQCYLFNREAGRACHCSADVEVSNMNIMPQCDIFEEIMVLRMYRVVDIILDYTRRIFIGIRSLQ